MATDAQLLEQNLVMEHGNANTALKVLAERYLREGDELVLIALSHERTIAELQREIAYLKSRASRGYNQWPPPRQPRPLKLDASKFEAVGVLPVKVEEIERENAPHS
jgi:hypothetical protein